MNLELLIIEKDPTIHALKLFYIILNARNYTVQ